MSGLEDIFLLYHRRAELFRIYTTSNKMLLLLHACLCISYDNYIKLSKHDTIRLCIINLFLLLHYLDGPEVLLSSSSFIKVYLLNASADTK